MGRLVQLGAGTVTWTVFQWWAVIGWPVTIEGNLAALLLASAASVIGLTAWHVCGNGWSGPRHSWWQHGRVESGC